MIENYSFESFIIQCCKSNEYQLRKFIKRILTRNGFRIIEDSYTSHREGFSGIHNLLAIRGEGPKVCLVAHTDVCRDHGYGYTWQANDTVNPVIKVAEIDKKIRRIIQDENCQVQVGGDDRLGVAINMWVALNTGYDIGLLFTTDEESGCVSANRVSFKELNEFELLCQVDRGNHSNQLVNHISGTRLCNDETAERLIEVSKNIGLPRKIVTGFLTDVMSIKRNGMCKNACNMTCGYHNSYGDSSDEFIDIQEAQDTLTYVASIVQHYELGESLESVKGFGNTNKEVQKIVDNERYDIAAEEFAASLNVPNDLKPEVDLFTNKHT